MGLGLSLVALLCPCLCLCFSLGVRRQYLLVDHLLPGALVVQRVGDRACIVRLRLRFVEQRGECVERLAATAAAHPALAQAQLLRPHAKCGLAGRAARQHHRRVPSRRTQPSSVAPTASAMKGA